MWNPFTKSERNIKKIEDLERSRNEFLQANKGLLLLAKEFAEACGITMYYEYGDRQEYTTTNKKEVEEYFYPLTGERNFRTFIIANGNKIYLD